MYSIQIILARHLYCVFPVSLYGLELFPSPVNLCYKWILATSAQFNNVTTSSDRKKSQFKKKKHKAG